MKALLIIKHTLKPLQGKKHQKNRKKSIHTFDYQVNKMYICI